jgi:hypothetical protein
VYDRLVEIRKQGAFEVAGEAEPEPKDRAVTFVNFSEGLGLIEIGIKVFEDTD